MLFSKKEHFLPLPFVFNYVMQLAPFSTAVTLRSGLAAYQIELGNYWVDFIPNGSKLVVSFENLGTGGGPDPLRDPWGMSFLKKREVSVLGIKWKVADWYRGKALHEFFRSGEFGCFIEQFASLVVMGGSMGGYAALAFAEVFPGALVIAHNPQTTLAAAIVPWDRRFGVGRAQDWTGDFIDGVRAASHARLIYMTYDPFDIADRRHVERLSGANVVRLKMPFLGHATPEYLLKMKILSKITDLAIAEQLTTEVFAKLVRPRRTLARYYFCMFHEAKRQDFKELALLHGARITPPDAQLFAIAFRYYAEHRQYQTAAALYRDSAIGDLPMRQREIKALAGISLYRTGDPADRAAAIAIADAINQNSENIHELSASAELLAGIGRFRMAARLSRQLIGLAPTFHDGYWILARSQRAMARPQVALLTIETAEKFCGGIGQRFKALRIELEREIEAAAE